MVGITVLGSGSRGNAVVIHSNDGAVLLDAGFSGIELRRRLEVCGVDEGSIKAILVSHEHDDHTRGVGVLARRWEVPVYTNSLTGMAIRDRDPKTPRLSLFSPGTAFDAGGFAITPFTIPHDAVDPVAFVFRTQKQKIGIATDLGHASQLVCHQLQECDILIVESNHDIGLLQNSARPWSLKQRILSRHGHLSNPASMDLIRQVLHSRTRQLVLAHASEECNRYELVEKCALECLASLKRQDIVPLVARQHTPLATVWVE